MATTVPPSENALSTPPLERDCYGDDVEFASDSDVDRLPLSPTQLNKLRRYFGRPVDASRKSQVRAHESAEGLELRVLAQLTRPHSGPTRSRHGTRPARCPTTTRRTTWTKRLLRGGRVHHSRLP